MIGDIHLYGKEFLLTRRQNRKLGELRQRRRKLLFECWLTKQATAGSSGILIICYFNPHQHVLILNLFCHKSYLVIKDNRNGKKMIPRHQNDGRGIHAMFFRSQNITGFCFDEKTKQKVASEVAFMCTFSAIGEYVLSSSNSSFTITGHHQPHNHHNQRKTIHGIFSQMGCSVTYPIIEIPWY